MLILISTNILDMALDLMENEFFSHLTSNNAIIFRVDMSSYVHIDNKKDILILVFGKGSTQGLGEQLKKETAL